MKIFKFKDKVDGKFAFVFAKDKEAASNKLAQTTAIPFDLVDFKNASDFDTAIILINHILPF